MTTPPGDGAPAQQAVERRLAALRSEYESGQVGLAELERQAAFVRERLLMLRGAIQAFDDLQAELGRSDVDSHGEPGAACGGPG